MKDGFPERLQRLRERRGLSRKVLSELCGLSKNMIARYERGEKEPTLGTAKVIAAFFGVAVDYLAGEK